MITYPPQLRMMADKVYVPIFSAVPTFEQFHIECFGMAEDVRQIYDLCGEDIRLMNAVCSLSAYGFGYVEIRAYVIDQVASKP